MGYAVPEEVRAVKAVTAFVSGDLALYGAATLKWHMNLVRNLSPRGDERLAEGLLNRLNLQPDMQARALSAGQKEKALLLLALARRPEVLIVDEPIAALDPIARHELIQFLLETKDQRRAFVFSFHCGKDIAALADEVAFIHTGQVLALAPAAELLSTGNSLEEVFLQRAASVDGRAA